MAYVFETPNLGMPPIANHGPSSNAAGRSVPWKLGDIQRAVDPTYGVGEFIYLQGVVSTVLGSAVIYNADDWTSTLADSSVPTTGPLAVAMSACVASEYGWYQIGGKGIIKAGTVADNAKVWLTTTPGQIDDATNDGYMIHNCKLASADGTPSAGLAEIELHRPFVDGIATND